MSLLRVSLVHPLSRTSTIIDVFILPAYASRASFLLAFQSLTFPCFSPSQTNPQVDRFLRFYLFIFREGKGGRETLMCQRYIDRLPLPRPQLGTWSATQACVLTGTQTGDSSVHRPALSPPSHTSQGKLIFSKALSSSHSLPTNVQGIVFANQCLKTPHKHLRASVNCSLLPETYPCLFDSYLFEYQL